MKIGSEPCIGEMVHATYTGPIEILQGKGARIMDSRIRNHVGAQFDDRYSGYGFGWHRFRKEEFTIDPNYLPENQTDCPSETRS
jgi:hypothetical protein